MTTFMAFQKTFATITCVSITLLSFLHGIIDGYKSFPLEVGRITETDPQGGEGGSSPGQILNP